jgi:hypothetical protein
VVFLDENKNGSPFFYVGEYRTIAGLSIFPPDSHISVIEFGAKDFNGYEWATERELPQLENMRELCSFLQQDIDLVNFELKLRSDFQNPI